MLDIEHAKLYIYSVAFSDMQTTVCEQLHCYSGYALEYENTNYCDFKRKVEAYSKRLERVRTSPLTNYVQNILEMYNYTKFTACRTKTIILKRLSQLYGNLIEDGKFIRT